MQLLPDCNALETPSRTLLSLADFVLMCHGLAASLDLRHDRCRLSRATHQRLRQAGRGNLKTVAVIQARMGSSRLPGKVLATLQGETVLARTVERTRAIGGVDEVVVATTRASADDAVAKEAERLNVGCTRGSEGDVLSRYVEAARLHGADVVVRITSDCPLLDPAASGRVVAALQDRLRAGEPVDYASNTIERRYPRGLDTEAFTRAALERVHRVAQAPREREHVTLYMYEHPAEFSLISVSGDADHASQRWTVDTEADLEMVRQVYARLDPVAPSARRGRIFGMEEVLALLEREPWIAAINADVEQKRA
jgi:spore coat polysaccharide biosynthesis protein SpsF